MKDLPSLLGSEIKKRENSLCVAYKVSIIVLSFYIPSNTLHQFISIILTASARNNVKPLPTSLILKLREKEWNNVSRSRKAQHLLSFC